jgi:hypothetical protein
MGNYWACEPDERLKNRNKKPERRTGIEPTRKYNMKRKSIAKGLMKAMNLTREPD